ncbi:MAG: hypothetical protein ACFFCQ_04350, partial [Promethearchaeota archaeon]
MKKEIYQKEAKKLFYGRIGDFNFKSEVKGINLAMFPINSFQEIPMELPKGNIRKNIRGAYFRMGTEITQEKLIDEKRILKLPISSRAKITVNSGWSGLPMKP